MTHFSESRRAQVTVARFETFVVFFACLEDQRKRQHIERIGEASARNARWLTKEANG